MRAEMQDELSGSIGGPAFFYDGGTGPRCVGGDPDVRTARLVVGVAVGGIWGFLMDSALNPLSRMMIAIVLCITGATTMGFLVGGELKPRADTNWDGQRDMDDARLHAEKDAFVSVHLTDQGKAEGAVKVLRDLGPTRVDRIDAGGAPLPPQADHPRPADTEGMWWRPTSEG